MIRSRGAGVFWAVVCAACGAMAPATPQNLLANSGFEELVADRPAGWDLYVEPMAGAFGRLDGDARSGRYAVMLHTPVPYARDPANNWSQNIIGAYGGKRLRASAYIKVRDAQEAALWVQCWRRRPVSVIASASSGVSQPVYGTRHWEKVSFTLDVPRNTDFITVRCVLLGTGTAWFDDVTLEIDHDATEPQRKSDATPSSAHSGERSLPDKTAAGDADAPPSVLKEADRAARDAATQRAADLASVARMDEELTRLREANIALAEALDQMRAAHDAMLQQLGELQQQLEQMRGETPAPMAPRLRQRRHAPPLVPLGEDWRKYR